MDNIKSRHNPHRAGPTPGSGYSRGTAQPKGPAKKQRHTGQRYWLVRSLGKVAAKGKQTAWAKYKKTEFARWPKKQLWRRGYVWAVLLLFIVSTVGGILQPYLDQKPYNISEAARAILPKKNQKFGELLKDDFQNNQFAYNLDGSSASSEFSASTSNQPRFSATFNKQASQGIKITDTTSQVDFIIKPKFPLAEAKKEDNQIMYKLAKHDGVLVYTNRTASVKEDIILESYSKDSLTFEFELQLQSGLEARVEKDGSMGVYGSSLPITGNVSASSESDQALLEKARQNAKKDKLLFQIPAPVVLESGKNISKATSRFVLSGNKLSVITDNLNQANFPLSIDPTVYIETAAKLMRGNNETNVDFDVDNELIQKSQTTGARINGWADTTEMNSGIWDQSTTTASGYVYRAGGRTDPTIPHIVGQQSSVQATNSASFVVDMPSTRPAGDLYVVLIAHDGTGAITPPAGWTEYADTREHAAYYKVGTDQGGGNESASYTFTGGSEQWSGVVLRIQGFNSGSPISGTAGTGSSASAAIPIFPTTTPAQDATLIIRSVGVNAAQPSAFGWLPSGHTKIYSATSSTDAESAALLVASMDQPPLATVATGTSTIADDGLVNDTYGASSIAIRPATVTAAIQTSVQWAKFDSTTQAIVSPNPGSGTCTGWCTNSSYDLRAARVGMSMVSYNGYLYALGGTSTGASAGGTSTVWIAKLGVNGEPQLWHPTGGTPDYWFVSSNTLPAAASYTSAAAYNNKLYLLGGVNTAGTSLNTVHIADLKPTGDIGSWSTTGMQTLPSARFGHAVHVYNDYMYLIGGNNSGSLLSTVHYSKINSDGTMNAWTATSSFATARSSFGGAMTSLWGGYIYLAGGCSALTSGYCSTVASDVQLASINADGTLADWNPILNLSNQRMGYSFVAWQNGLYRFGGCNRQNTTTGVCYAVHRDVEYGVINPDGDASTVSNSVTSGSAPCSGGSPYNCNLPPAGDDAGEIGQMSNAAVVNNGFIYVIGGCADISATDECSTGEGMSANTAYAALSSTGTIVSAASCSGTTYGSWCVDNTHALLDPVITYDTGTLTQAGTTVTGSGTTWVAGHVGLMLLYHDGTTAKITARASNTSITVDVSKTVGTAQYYHFVTPIHNAGTFTQATNTITGTGTTFIAGHVNDTFVYNDGSTALITARASNTSITVNVSKTVGSAQTYGIVSNGVGAGSATVFNNTIYIVGGTDGSGSWNDYAYRVSLSSDGSLATNWLIQGFENMGLDVDSGTGGFQTLGYSYSFTRSNPSAAASVPGNLYVLGGCIASGGIGCNTYYTAVNKCNILTSGALAACSTTGQMQIDADNINTGSQGLGLMAGTIYANRIYLVGGACTAVTSYINVTDPCASDTSPVINNNANRKETIYAKIDNSNNIVDNVSGLSGGTWDFTSGLMDPVRRRAVSFGYNGYIYSLAGYSGSDSLQDLLFAKIDVSTGDMGSFSSSGVVVTPRWDLRAIVSNGYVYAIGGCATGAAPAGCTAMQPQVQTFQLYNNDSGAPVAYGNGNNVGFDRVGGSATVMNGYIYYAGGCTVTACSTMTNTNYYAAIDVYGVVGTWTAAASNLPASLGWGKLLNSGGTLYYVGGQTGAANTTGVSTVYYTTGISSGVPTWSGTAASGGIGDTASQAAQVRTQFGAAVWENRLYIIGGYNNAGTVQNSVYISPRLASGGNISVDTWISDTDTFNVARSGHTTVAYANNLYVLGGFDGTNYLNDTQFTSIGYKTGTIGQSGTTITGSGTTFTSAQVGSIFQYSDGSTATITAFGSATSLTVSVNKTVTAGESYVIQDGSIGAWQFSTSLPGPLSDSEGFAYNGYIYLIGGRSAATTCVPNTLVSPISANTTIASGNNSTGVGEWYETNQKYASDRYGSAAVYIQGKAYVMGGACNGTFAASAGRTQYTTLKSQPQVAKYSRMIDTDTDVFPNSWLLNGIDNSVGARWQVKYSSMHDVDTLVNPNEDCGTSTTMATMTTFGQATNFGDTTLGKVNTYTPKESGGGNINCARYYYFSISIDASQTFGYPEDVNRGPTIADISLFFTADPSKRLKHGKTFTGGEQQPIDTPCRVSNNNSNPDYANCPLP